MHFSDTEEKWEYIEKVHQLFMDFNNAYSYVATQFSTKTVALRERCCARFFYIQRKLVRLIKMCLMKLTAKSV
jgi:hypothetical protein